MYSTTVLDPADFEFPPNALGRRDPADDWAPFHIRVDGKHCDPRGLIIQPYRHVQIKTTAEIKAWLAANKIQMVRLDPAVVPAAIPSEHDNNS